MDFDALAASRIGMGLALRASRALPPAAARVLARRVARRLARDRSSAMVRAVRANQWVVSGRKLEGSALDEAVVEVLHNAGMFLYDLHHLPVDAQHSIGRLVVADEAFERLLAWTREMPLVVAGCHLGNFDLVGRALAYAGWRVQVLSVPDPNDAYRAQNELRERAGLEMTPVSLEALKRAARRLAEGGSVVTGLDRPLPEAAERVRFFGEEAPLPLLHVRLAMRAKVPVVVAGAPRGEDGRYRLVISDPIEMVGNDPMENAERVLASAERFIAAAPRQWAMPHAVWPHIEAPDGKEDV